MNTTQRWILGIAIAVIFLMGMSAGTPLIFGVLIIAGFAYLVHLLAQTRPKQSGCLVVLLVGPIVPLAIIYGMLGMVR